MDNGTNYKPEELIKDMKILINKKPFIQQFNASSFIDTKSFNIFNKLDAMKIHLYLNLLNFINIINAISNFCEKDIKQFTVILNKLGINFSWIKRDKDLVDVVVLTPKSSILYNHISTHGKSGIKEKEYKEKVKKFIKEEEKSKFDFGFCYEDLSISHLIEVLGEGTFELLPNVMYYVKKDVMKKLKELKLVEIPESYKLNESSFPGAIYSGFDETDLIIYT